MKDVQKLYKTVVPHSQNYENVSLRAALTLRPWKALSPGVGEALTFTLGELLDQFSPGPTSKAEDPFSSWSPAF